MAIVFAIEALRLLKKRSDILWNGFHGREFGVEAISCYLSIPDRDNYFVIPNGELQMCILRGVDKLDVTR